MQQETAPPTPAAPLAPTPAVETTPTPQTRSDVLTDPAGTVKECNLTCFRECLDLKKYVPFPVIQQCISLRCNCNLDESVEKLTGLIELNSINTVSPTPLNTGKHSVLGDFFFILLLIALISGAYIYYKNVIQKDEKYRSSVRDKESYYDTGYEQLSEEPLYQHF